MTAKRTRGPWHIAPDRPLYGALTIHGYRGAHVATVWNGGTRDPAVADCNAEYICMTDRLVDSLRELIPLADNLAGGREVDRVLETARALVERADQLTDPNLPTKRRKPR